MAGITSHVFLLMTIFLIAFSSNSFAEFSYNITRTWDNQIPSDTPKIHLEFLPSSPFPDFLEVRIAAPFYNDPLPPSAPTEEPFVGLWDYEVVEAFFLGDNQEYLELEFSPSGHYLLYFLKGVRNVSEPYMPLANGSFVTEKNDTHWTGRALIPGHYFPCNTLVDLLRFNAYAIHKSGANRRYMSLFPVENGEISAPDFHYLAAFQEINFPKELNPFCPRRGEFYNYMISKTWNGTFVEPSAHTYLQYDYNEGKGVVNIKVNAPLYNDPLPPENNDTHNPFPGLWDYEVVEAFFLGEDNETYLEIELSPSRHYLVYFLEGVRNVTNGTLQIDNFRVQKSNPNLATLEGEGSRWMADAEIPSVYFPCSVAKMNGYAIHWSGERRRYLSLFPVRAGEIPVPDFHYLSGFGNFTFGREVNHECNGSGSNRSFQLMMYIVMCSVGFKNLML